MVRANGRRSNLKGSTRPRLFGLWAATGGWVALSTVLGWSPLGSATWAIPLAIAVLATHAIVLIPAVARSVDLAVDGIRWAVGAALSYIAFGAIFVVLAVVGFVRDAVMRGWKLAGGRFAVSRTPDAGATGWSRVGADPDPRPSPNLAGGGLVDHSRSTRLSWFASRTVTRTVVAVLSIESAVMVGVSGVRSTADPPALSGSANRSQAPALPALPAFAGADWVSAADAEMKSAVGQMVYSAFETNSVRDFRGTYVNVVGGARRTYLPRALRSDPRTSDPVDVWFFGGSAMFGYDLQRDDHTIASEFVRLAEKDGIVVRAKNFGTPGSVNYQEVMRLSLLLAAGQRPDLVIMYDGANDRSAQGMSVLDRVGNAGEPDELSAIQYRSKLADSGAIPGATSDPPTPLVPADGSRPDVALGPLTSSARAVGKAMAAGRSTACALANEHGFGLIQFWQPTLEMRTPQQNDERQIVQTTGADDDSVAAQRAVGTAILSELPDGVVDLTGVFDRVDAPVFSDFVHTNETGAHLVARSMYRRLANHLADPQRRTGCM